MAKRKTRKMMPSTEIAARRQNRVLRLMGEGKSTKQMLGMLEISHTTLMKDIEVLRKSFKSQPPAFIPPKGVGNWNRAKARRVVNLIETAKQVIEGRKRIKVVKRGVRKKAPSPQSLETNRRIDARLIRDPVDSDSKISKEFEVHSGVVATRRKQLEDAGRIRGDTLSERFKKVRRKAERKTSYLNKEKRDIILEEKGKTIQGKASYLYHRNRPAFDFTNMLPETIVEEMVERLDWKLQVYDPNSMPGPKKTKLERYFSKKLTLVASDLKRKAWKKYRKITSLEFGMDAKKDIRRTLEALTEFKELTVTQLEQISTRLKLNLLEKAILFGSNRTVNLSDRRIAKAIGISKSGVNQIRNDLKKRVKKLLLE